MACSSHKEVQRTESYESEASTQQSTVESGYLAGVETFLKNTELTASDITIDFSPRYDTVSARARASPCRVKIAQLRKTEETAAELQVQEEFSKVDSIKAHGHIAADIEQQQESTTEHIDWRTNILGFLFGILTLRAAVWAFGKRSKNGT